MSKHKKNEKKKGGRERVYESGHLVNTSWQKQVKWQSTYV